MNWARSDVETVCLILRKYRQEILDKYRSDPFHANEACVRTSAYIALLQS